MSNLAPDGGHSRKTADQLLPEVYEELRHLAAAKMANQPPEHTLQPTALVHEAYLRLVNSNQNRWKDDRHFFAAAATAMQCILVDWARKKRRIKRGSGSKHLNLEDVQLAEEATPEAILALNDALETFAREDPVKAELVRMRFFGGISLVEASKALGLSLAAAKRYMSFSRAWLYRYISSKK